MGAQYAVMFDLWSPEHSVLREKVIEHIFLAELSRAMLLDLKQPFEVLRAEFDANGYDIALQAGGLLRHVQLKATASGGKRAHVDVQLSLREKPSGCVIWLFVDPDSLTIGPILWFGDERGARLPPLGDREAKHSRRDATGTKNVRSSLRRLRKGEFTRFHTMGELVEVLFPPSNHRLLLERHLSRNIDLAGLLEIMRGLRWETSAPLAYLIDGYVLAEEAGIDDPVLFLDHKREEAERSGRWAGSVLELWLLLFLEHRRDHFGGAIGTTLGYEPLPLLDELCAALSQSLIAADTGIPNNAD